MRSFLEEKAHYLADFLTLSRFIIAFLIVYYSLQSFALRTASIMVVMGWSTDVFDGMVARKFGGTFLGWFDLPADLCFSTSILFYELHSDFLPLKISLILTALFLIAAVVLKNEAPMMFWMGMVYGSFIISAFFYDFTSFVLLVSGVIFALVVNPARGIGQIRKFFRESKKMFEIL